ncbi:MAG: hypothetical protein ACI9NQ_001048 [Paracoccaceae bacterium]|jgi:hypothetical protein
MIAYVFGEEVGFAVYGLAGGGFAAAGGLSVSEFVDGEFRFWDTLYLRASDVEVIVETSINTP